MSLPVVWNLTVYRGDDWSQVFRFLTGDVPEDLTGATVAAEARARDGTVTALDVVVENVTDGRIRVSLPEESLPPASYAYDVEVTNGSVQSWVRGSLTVSRDVTNELP